MAKSTHVSCRVARFEKSNNDSLGKNNHKLSQAQFSPEFDPITPLELNIIAFLLTNFSANQKFSPFFSRNIFFRWVKSYQMSHQFHSFGWYNANIRGTNISTSNKVESWWGLMSNFPASDKKIETPSEIITIFILANLQLSQFFLVIFSSEIEFQKKFGIMTNYHNILLWFSDQKNNHKEIQIMTIFRIL